MRHSHQSLRRAKGQAPSMSKATRATAALDRAGVTYFVHAYNYDPDADRSGVQAAESLGVSPGLVLKTLMAVVDGKPVCVIVPSDKDVSMKRLAAARGGRSARMMRPQEAERLTGYHVGGISPFGQKQQLPTVIDPSALEPEWVFMNGGQRGLQVGVRPGEACDALQAKVALVIA
jgi:Cys-tRNA(Pro)/Cys-tRNA(Cys) deacylase